MNIREYDLNTSEDKLINACRKIEESGLITEAKAFYLDYLLSLLNFKQQKKLLKEQNKFNKKFLAENKKLIDNSKKLVKPTWILAIATITLAISTVILVFVAGFK